MLEALNDSDISLFTEKNGLKATNSGDRISLTIDVDNLIICNNEKTQIFWCHILYTFKYIYRD